MESEAYCKPQASLANDTMQSCIGAQLHSSLSLLCDPFWMRDWIVMAFSSCEKSSSYHLASFQAEPVLRLQAAEWYDPAQYGAMYYVMADPTFWFLQV